MDKDKPFANTIFYFPRKEECRMQDIRNSDGRLVCRLDEATGTVEISIKGCTTLIKRKPDGTMEVVNIKKPAAWEQQAIEIRETA